jgi:hypothetical protein
MHLENLENGEVQNLFFSSFDVFFFQQKNRFLLRKSENFQKMGVRSPRTP